MKVTSITRQVKNPDRVNIFIDGKYALSLTTGQLLEQKLKIETELDANRLDELKKLSLQEKFRLKVLGWLMLRPRSVRELRQYIQKQRYKDPSLSDVGWIVEDMIRRNYVNDEEFAKWWVQRTSRRSKSQSNLRAELASKGIERSIVQEVLREVDDTSLLTDLVNNLRKKTKYSDQAKLIRYLQSKGFRYSSIMEALELDAGDN